MPQSLALERPAWLGGNAQMPATMWTIVLNARDLTSPHAEAALAKLCETYWYPLYAFVRRQGHDHHQAQDLTQAFFEHLLECPWLNGVAKEKGKFRTFLLCALSNFLINEGSKAGALKRGGGNPIRFLGYGNGRIAPWRRAGGAARSESGL